jgi:murein DD-endopeptidase MepM/ murein hydrolase activator NlpD
LVSIGERVVRGDVLGTVGNTGNARTTPPHLHFGIYERGRGAIDPYWFIAPTHIGRTAARR